jgi:hypothetical protein
MAETTTSGTERAARKVREGVVASTTMDKTAVVVVTTRKPHPLYKKTALRARREQRAAPRRPRPRRRDPAAVEAEALAPRRDPRAGQVRRA